jgi:DNA-directed RNA polymerase subunit RPC12/RpoP
MGYKKVCFNCRKAFSVYTNNAETINLTCPECGGTTAFLKHKFRPPKRNDLRQWDTIQFLVDNGFLFDHVYKQVESGGYEQVAYPETMEEAKVFVIEYKKQAKVKT